MTEITMKNSTKQEIFDAYTEMKKKLDKSEAMKDDPVKQKESERLAAVSSSANEMISTGILAPEIINQYKDVCESIRVKKEELKDLYGIEAEANSLVALINAHKDKEQELKEKYAALTAEVVTELNAKQVELNNQIAELEIRKAEVLASTEAEHIAIVKEKEVERKRAEEEYNYNLARQRKIENDTWEDEKKARENRVAEKEIAVLKLEEEVTTREARLDELEAKVAEIPALVEAAKADGIKQGKVEEQKSIAFEVRAINQKNEYAHNAMVDRIQRLEADLAQSRENEKTLSAKLDAAYTEMRNLASETVKSANGVKIIDRDNVNGK